MCFYTYLVVWTEMICFAWVFCPWLRRDHVPLEDIVGVLEWMVHLSIGSLLGWWTAPVSWSEIGREAWLSGFLIVYICACMFAIIGVEMVMEERRRSGWVKDVHLLRLLDRIARDRLVHHDVLVPYSSNFTISLPLTTAHRRGCRLPEIIHECPSTFQLWIQVGEQWLCMLADKHLINKPWAWCVIRKAQLNKSFCNGWIKYNRATDMSVLQCSVALDTTDIEEGYHVRPHVLGLDILLPPLRGMVADYFLPREWLL
jgi:hypothetical protein